MHGSPSPFAAPGPVSKARGCREIILGARHLPSPSSHHLPRAACSSLRRGLRRPKTTVPGAAVPRSWGTTGCGATASGPDAGTTGGDRRGGREGYWVTGRQVGRAPALAEKGMVSRLQLLGDEGLSPIPRTGAGDTRGQGTHRGQGTCSGGRGGWSCSCRGPEAATAPAAFS